MLKYTGVTLELITDISQILFIEKGIRGGISQCSNRYAKANNKYMGDLYDSNEPDTYLMYFDVNNLYGWAMERNLPEGDFEWVSEKDFNTLNYFVPEDSEIGYILEVDLHVSPEKHDYFNDLPFCPTHECPPN